MDSKKSFKLLVVSNTTPFLAVVQIIYFHDCRQDSVKKKFCLSFRSLNSNKVYEWETYLLEHLFFPGAIYIYFLIYLLL